jgi:hypothetical protein
MWMNGAEKWTAPRTAHFFVVGRLLFGDERSPRVLRETLSGSAVVVLTVAPLSQVLLSCSWSILVSGVNQIRLTDSSCN